MESSVDPRAVKERKRRIREDIILAVFIACRDCFPPLLFVCCFPSPGGESGGSTEFVSHDRGIESGYDIRTVPDLLGHGDVKTTMLCTHVLNRGGRGVRSPADTL